MSGRTILPSARADLFDALDHYGEHSSQVAKAFLAEFERNLDLIAAYPEASPIARGEVRRKVFRRYPYSILYFLDDDQPVVVALMHHRRRPDYWHHRI